MIFVLVTIAAFAILAAVMSLVQFSKVRRELASRRPDLSEWIYGPWWGPEKYGKLFRTYKSEFPDSHRVRMYWCWSIAYVLSGVAVAMLFLAGRS
jgi:hypothetical protein